MRLKNIPRSQDMSKGNKYLIPIIGVVIAVTLLIGQSGGYLSQKLMVENNIRERVKEALSKLIDSHKYVINIDVELEILDKLTENEICVGTLSDMIIRNFKREEISS